MKVVSKVIIPLQLTHEAYCEQVGRCECQDAKVSGMSRSPTGERIVGVSSRRFPPVVTLIAGQVAELPDRCGELPNVKSMIGVRALRIVR